MSDDEAQIEDAEESEAQEPPPAPAHAAADDDDDPKTDRSTRSDEPAFKWAKKHYDFPLVPKVSMFNAGKSSKLPKEKLMASEGLIPVQNGTNKYASQKGQSGFGAVRDVLYKPKGTGGASPVSEEKAKLTDGIIPLQSGTNKLASQAGMTGFGMNRWVFYRGNPEQDRGSQGFIHLQMGTNKFANQAGMTGFGMPRHNVHKYKDTQRGDMAHDESTLPRQTCGSHGGACQAGMTGFGMPRNTTNPLLKVQDRKSQGFVPFQMGINWADSQAGKTGFGMPRLTFTPITDDTRADLTEVLAKIPEVPFWIGMERFHANQAGMTGFGMPRDVKGNYLRRLW